MSFLNPVRLAFAGTFQADVSTVNNDVRHFDNASFQPAFQDLQAGKSLNGWWNPNGSGAFRLIDCRVTGVAYGDGTATADRAEDPAVGMWIGGSSGRTSGKLVDIDPQWQLASAPWGLDMRLTDGDRDLVGGRYRPAAFRDLWFSRLTGSSQDGAASSTFQSVLEGLHWADEAGARSRFAGELLSASPERLSVRLATFGYQGSARSPRFTLGTVVGAIGPQLAGEPTSFVAGRRFTPASQFSSWNGITYFTGMVVRDSRSLLLDLSNALQISDGRGTPSDIGTMVAGILRDPATAENTPVTADSFEPVAEVPYRRPGWLQASGGVFAAPMTPAQLALAADHPLALVTTAAPDPGADGFSFGDGIVAIRETADGLFLGAEPAVHRIDAGGTSSFTVHASRYGAPIADAPVLLNQTGPVPGQGGTGPSDDPNPPTAPIPDIGVPEDRFHLPATCSTGPDGTVVVEIGTDPRGPGNPRGYLDGQLYLVDYRAPGQSDTARQPFDYVVVHARDAVAANDSPTWREVGPILTQYANLYPIMSRQLIDLADPADVLRHRELLRMAFSADIADPNHMPVTRDLSGPKLQLLLRWLDEGTLDAVPGPPPAAPAARGAPAAILDDDDDGGEEPGSKTKFAAGFQHAMRGARRR